MKRKPRQKKGGGAIGETARLGHPGSIPDSPLRSSSQIPTPPRGYNDAFVSDISTEPKRRGKLNGYGRISDRRNMSMFKNDACVIPM